MPKRPENNSTFIPLDDMGRIQEDKVQPEGTYDLVIKKASTVTSKKGNPMLQVIIAFDGVENAANIFHNITLPTPDDDQKAMEFKKLLIARFCQLFGIDYKKGLNLEDFPGATAVCKVSEKEYEGAISNVLVLPSLN